MSRQIVQLNGADFFRNIRIYPVYVKLSNGVLFPILKADLKPRAAKYRLTCTVTEVNGKWIAIIS